MLAIAGACSPGATTSPRTTCPTNSPQQIIFPTRPRSKSKVAPTSKYAGIQMTTGEHAEAYSTYIDGHLQNIGQGKTYATIGATSGPPRPP